MKKKQTPQIKLKRVYDKPLKADGYRVLVDRLWPRGLSKEKAALSEWARELAPTDRLRRWFDHDLGGLASTVITFFALKDNNFPFIVDFEFPVFMDVEKIEPLDCTTN